MPRVDCDEETLNSMLNTVIGSCVTRQQIELLQNDIYSWSDVYIDIFKNFYMYMINESNITSIIVNERLRGPIELRIRKQDGVLLHIFSIDFLKSIFSHIPSFSITKSSTPIQFIKRKYELCFDNDECSYDSLKISAQLTAMLMRFYISADLMAYNYFYYMEMKKIAEDDDPKIDIPGRKFLHNIFSNDPNSKTQHFIHDNKKRALEIVRSKYQIDRRLDSQSDTSEDTDSTFE